MNFYDLKKELTELQDAFDNESNEERRIEIHQHISTVKKNIEDYDLGDDDLFECSHCREISDIEDSVKNESGALVCVNCTSK